MRHQPHIIVCYINIVCMQGASHYIASVDSLLSDASSLPHIIVCYINIVCTQGASH